MAKVTSGSFNTTAYSGRYLVLSWSAEQSIVNNTSAITWTLKGAGGGSGYYKAGNFKVIIAGETVYSSSTRINLYNGTTVASGKKVIYHNTNGTKSFSASAEAGIYTTAVNCSGSGSWELIDIPRAATITGAPNFTDEDNPTITFSNPAGSAATVAACISLDGTNIDIPYRNVTGSSYTFNFTEEERNTLINATLDGSSRTVRFYLRTIIAGNYFFTYVTKTLTIVNAAPVMVPTVLDDGIVSKTLTGAPSTVFIKGYNNITANINVEAKKGAIITHKKITNGGTEIKDKNTANFKNAETGNFIFTAEDSRGLKTTLTLTRQVIPYFKPTCNMVKNNVSTDGKYFISLSGQFYNGSFGAVSNTLTVQFRFRESGGTYSAWQALSPTLNGNKYTAAATITGLNYQNSYDIQARAVDTVGANDTNYIAETEEFTVTAIPAFCWSKGDFSHHTHVYFDNNKVIKGYDTDGNLWNALEPCNVYNATSLGWGSYSNSKGSTEVWGNNVKITAKNTLYINGRTYGANKLLWSSSGWWMGENQTANLNGAISAQPNGIVLVWSLRRNDATEDASIQTFFISKYEVAQLDSKPHSFLFTINSNLSVFGAKYLYIGDTAINGYSGNTFYGTASGSGITFDNRYFVLRYVLGI